MEQLLKQVVSDVLNISVAEIDENISIRSCEQWDSLKHIELMSSIEDNFDIGRLSLDEIVLMTSYKSIARVLKSKLSSQRE